MKFNISQNQIKVVVYAFFLMITLSNNAQKDKIDAYVEKITKKFEKAKEARIMKEWNEAWEDSETSSKSKDRTWNGRPIAIVRKFIIDKGLKIYGGLALNELLKKKKKPIYSDYFTFSD